MLTLTLAAMLTTPTAEAGRFDLTGLRCVGDQVAFDGACRSLSWFDDLSCSGWTIETVVGCDVIGDCEHAMLLEVSDDSSKVRAVVVTEDSSVASVNDRAGYPVVRRVVHTDLGDSLNTKIVEVDGSGSTVLYDGPNEDAVTTNGVSGEDRLTDVAIGTMNYEKIEWTLMLGGQDFWVVGELVLGMGNFEIQR